MYELLSLALDISEEVRLECLALGEDLGLGDDVDMVSQDFKQ